MKYDNMYMRNMFIDHKNGHLIPITLAYANQKRQQSLKKLYKTYILEDSSDEYELEDENSERLDD